MKNTKKKVSHNNDLIPTYETNKKTNRSDKRHKQNREINRKQKNKLMLRESLERFWFHFQCDTWVLLLIRTLHFSRYLAVRCAPFERDWFPLGGGEAGFHYHLCRSVIIIWCGAYTSAIFHPTPVIITAPITEYKTSPVRNYTTRSVSLRFSFFSFDNRWSRSGSS